jgi:transposase
MRFVPVKNVDQQAVLMMHRARNLLVRQRTMAINALRAHMAEFGVIAPQGAAHVEWLVCVSAWKSDPVFGVIGVQN